MMRVYLSGPISTLVAGVSHEELKDRFGSLQLWLGRNYGNWEVVNPLQVAACETKDCNGSRRAKGEKVPMFYDHSWFCYLKHDLIEMLKCDAICFLPGYEDSPGAQLEKDVAFRVGLSPYYALLNDEEGWFIA